MTRNPVADLAGGAYQPGQLRERKGVFTQQRQIGGAPADGFDHEQHPADGRVRVIGLGACFENYRHQGIEPFTTFARESLIETTVSNASQ